MSLIIKHKPRYVNKHPLPATRRHAEVHMEVSACFSYCPFQLQSNQSHVHSLNDAVFSRKFIVLDVPLH